jgi:FkbM family methyltransferase
VIKPVRVLARMFAGSSPLTQLLATNNQKLDRIYENLENQATAASLGIDRIVEGLREQMANANGRFDLLIEIVTKRTDKLIESLENQSQTANLRADKLIESFENQSQAANLRLDKLIKAVENLNGGRSGSSKLPDRLGPSAADRVLEKHSSMAVSAKAPRTPPLRRLGNGRRKPVPTNDVAYHQALLDRVQLWEGDVPHGFVVDIFGRLTDAAFFGIDPAKVGGKYVRTELHPLAGATGELWFEWVDWLVAAQEARNNFVMIMLGARYGAQPVGAYKALQIVNPMPCRLVAVEPEPQNFQWLQKHMRDNGLDPDDHWLLQIAMSDSNDPIFFASGTAGSGVNNCVATNTALERRTILDQLINDGRAEDTLAEIMLFNSIDTSDVTLPGHDTSVELKLVSSATLKDLLEPFAFVDYLKADIQQSEILVFPPYMDLLGRKVRRVHISTHSNEHHEALSNLFKEWGWEIVFDYGPNAKFRSSLGVFETCDGVLTVRNPEL